MYKKEEKQKRRKKKKMGRQIRERVNLDFQFSSFEPILKPASQTLETRERLRR